MTDFVKRCEKAFIAVKVNDTIAVVLYPGNLGGKYTVAKDKPCSFARLFSGLAQCFPAVSADLFKQQKFNPRAGSVLNSEDPGRKHARIVGDNKVALVKVIDNFIKVLMFNRSALAVKHHKPRTVARFNWCLCYKLLGKFVIKVSGFHHLSSQSIKNLKNKFVKYKAEIIDNMGVKWYIIE